MLDLSDKFAPRATEEPKSYSLARESLDLPKKGQRFRHYKGSLYEVVGDCTIEATLEPGVLYQAVDPQQKGQLWMRPLSVFSGTTRAGQPRFSPLPSVNREAIKKYLPPSVITEEHLEVVLKHYDSPWRFFHSREHIFNMFETALRLKVQLTLEQSLAVLFHDIVYIPGAPEGFNEKQSVLLLQAFKSCIATPVDWVTVEQIIDDTTALLPSCDLSKAVLDLDLGSLGEDPIVFCASDELVWLENRHLLEPVNARQDYDTRRLRFLLSLANRGPLFSGPLSSLEDSARSNLEGLRQAWVQKYNT